MSLEDVWTIEGYYYKGNRNKTMFWDKIIIK